MSAPKDGPLLPPHSEDDPGWVPPRRNLSPEEARLRSSNRLLVALLVRLLELIRNRDTEEGQAEIEKIKEKFAKARQRIEDRGDG